MESPGPQRTNPGDSFFDSSLSATHAHRLFSLFTNSTLLRLPNHPSQTEPPHHSMLSATGRLRGYGVRRISLGMTTRPRSSMRRTIPVAFISRSPLSIGCACSLCRFWEEYAPPHLRGGIHFYIHAYFFFEQEQFENAAKLRPVIANAAQSSAILESGISQRTKSSKRYQPNFRVLPPFPELPLTAQNAAKRKRLERRRQESPFILFHQNAQRAQASPNDQIDWFHIRPILQSIYLCSKRQCKFRSATTFRMIRTKFRKSVAFRDGGCLS